MVVAVTEAMADTIVMIATTGTMVRAAAGVAATET
jgi:hypothetical protein